MGRRPSSSREAGSRRSTCSPQTRDPPLQSRKGVRADGGDRLCKLSAYFAPETQGLSLEIDEALLIVFHRRPGGSLSVSIIKPKVLLTNTLIAIERCNGLLRWKTQGPCASTIDATVRKKIATMCIAVFTPFKCRLASSVGRSFNTRTRVWIHAPSACSPYLLLLCTYRHCASVHAPSAPCKQSALWTHRSLSMAHVQPPCCVVHGSTKLARHAYSPNCRPALHFLAPRLYLFSFILADDSAMLLHFLRHYHRLGVWPSHTSVAIRARRSASQAATNATLQVLRQAGVPDSNVRMVLAPPSDAVKIQLTNEHLARLGSADWSIYADVDELFDYPCELQGAVRRNKYCFAGAMWDQLAADGNITEMAASPDLAEQYPLQCRIRATMVPRLQISKVILHRVYGNAHADAPPSMEALVRFRTTHSIIGNNSASTRCAVRGLVRHYTMTARQRVSNAQKAALRVAGTSASDHRNATTVFCLGQC